MRPVLEYGPLVWMGASSTTLHKLDSVQRRALHILGPGVLLQSLAARRHVAAMTYLYKLHCLSEPARLTAMVPPRVPSQMSTPQRTRQQAAKRHSYQLASVLDRRSRNSALRAFPHGLIHAWNSLPPATLSKPPQMKSLQSFKCKINELVSRQDWLWATDHL